MAERLVVGLSGSSGQILGVKLLEFLDEAGIESHLVVTETAGQILKHETEHTVDGLRELATEWYDNDNLFAAISSGSFRTDGMVVMPCSMKTLAGIASGYSDNLLLRAADVHLKEGKGLVLVARETPLSAIHLENMLKITRAGGVVLPPVLTMYNRPDGLDEMLHHILGKVLDQLDIENRVYERWG